MDVQMIAQAFANTLDPQRRAEAETQLEEVCSLYHLTNEQIIFH